MSPTSGTFFGDLKTDRPAGTLELKGETQHDHKEGEGSGFLGNLMALGGAMPLI